MEVFKPLFYDLFRCVASACPDSCCKEWAVVVDEDKAAFYRNLPGALGERLRNVLVEEDGETVMRIENGRCPMWRVDGLCRIQAELGEDALCTTCRDFPRITHDYGDFAELQLELSCPVAAQLIITGDDTPVKQVVHGGEAPDYDPQAMKTLLETRQAALEILADPAYTVAEALAALLLYGYSAQEQLDGGEVAEKPTREKLLRIPCQNNDGEGILRFFQKLEILTDAWRQRLKSPNEGVWTDIFRALARYFVRRYWLQAVADYDLAGRVKFIVTACIVIKLLGGDVCATAQLFSKEIENDATNVDAILDGAYDSPALTDLNLLGCLL